MDLYHYQSTEFLTLFRKRAPLGAGWQGSKYVVFILFFERLESEAKEIWNEIFH